ncbi:MAG: hypothetical protein KC464_24265, partial [Myxococcales bacterium]|nr:hypothetical protein [Myxococcales bacterium]
MVPSLIGVAHAQPLDPYGPDPDPDALAAGAKDAGDPEIDEAVAAALVARARELIAMEAWADAQQLLGEALVRSPGGAAAADAAALLPAVKAKLGIDAGAATTDVGVGGPGLGDPIDPDHQRHDPETPPVDVPAARGAGRGALAFHLAGYGAVVGFALIDPRDQNNGAGAGVLLGGLAGGLGGYFLARRADLDMAEARTLGSLTSWGEVIGGLIGDAAGADLDHDGIDEEDPLSTVVGASIGGGLGLIAGEVLRRRGGVTSGDVALIDSLAGMGVIGGLSMGALMQPSEGEGYSINAAFGAAGGVVVGLYLGNKHDVSVRRMLRVDLWAGAGAVVPWVLYGLVADDTT